MKIKKVRRWRWHFQLSKSILLYTCLFADQTILIIRLWSRTEWCADNAAPPRQQETQWITTSIRRRGTLGRLHIGAWWRAARVRPYPCRKAYDLRRVPDQQDKATMLSTDTSIFLIVPRYVMLENKKYHTYKIK